MFLMMVGNLVLQLHKSLTERDDEQVVHLKDVIISLLKQNKCKVKLESSKEKTKTKQNKTKQNKTSKQNKTKTNRQTSKQQTNKQTNKQKQKQKQNKTKQNKTKTQMIYSVLCLPDFVIHAVTHLR